MADNRKLHVCAQLANYAYVSGKPNVPESDLRNAWPAGYTLDVKEEDLHYSHSWIHRPEYQHRFYKSHAYVGRLKETKPSDDVNRIVVGFRGTWTAAAEPEEQQPAPIPAAAIAAAPWWSNLVNKALDKFSPSVYGMGDIYHDAMLIRTPYTKGVVWKWYTYWGTLILSKTPDIPLIRYLFWGRLAAAGWMNRPDGTASIDTRQYGLVHLGFWALWASNEGFAGYHRQGKMWSDPPDNTMFAKEGVMQSVWRILKEDAGKKANTEILIVGHSLGGAVSAFAALDIAEGLEKTRPDVKIFHATFGAPAVGNQRFAAHFKKQLGLYDRRKHQSWAVYHERDIVASCFQWLSEQKYSAWLGWFGWWSDWSHVGWSKKLSVKESKPAQKQSKGMTFSKEDRRKAKWILGFTCIFMAANVAAVLLSWFALPPCLLWPHYWKQTNPRSAWMRNDRNAVVFPRDAPDVSTLTVDDHSLSQYIELLGEEESTQGSVDLAST